MNLQLKSYFILLISLLTLNACESTSITGAPLSTEEVYQAVEDLVLEGDSEQAVVLLEEELKRNPENSDSLYLYANLLISTSRHDEAEAILEQIRANFPNQAEVLLSLSAISGIRGDTERQQQLLEQAADLDPQNSYVLSALGLLLLQTGHPDRARDTLFRALQADESNVEAIIALGLMEKDRDRRTAIEYFNRAISVDPENVLALYHRGVLYSSVLQLNNAFSDLNTAIELDPENSLLYLIRGQILFSSQHRVEEAFADFNTAIELDPQMYTAYMYRGQTNQRLGNTQDALADYRMALGNVKELEDTIRTQIGLLMFAERQWVQAREYLAGAAQRESDPGYSLLTGLTYMRQGDLFEGGRYLTPGYRSYSSDPVYGKLFELLINRNTESRVILAFQEEENPSNKIKFLFYLAQFNFVIGQNQNAQAYLRQMLELRSGAENLMEMQVARAILGE